MVWKVSKKEWLCQPEWIVNRGNWPVQGALTTGGACTSTPEAGPPRAPRQIIGLTLYALLARQQLHQDILMQKYNARKISDSPAMKLLAQTKALADETRLRLLGVLARYELNVGEIVQVMDMGQSRISRHLKILVDAGFVTYQRNGLWAFYSAQDKHTAPPLLQAVLDELCEFPEHQRDLDKAEQVLLDRRQSTTRFFDEVAADWIKMSRDIVGDFDLNQTILSHLAHTGVANQSGVVADLGCGPGLMLGLLADQAQHTIGVDNSPRMLEAAARLLPDSTAISLRLGDLEHLPLRDAEADAAIMSLVLHHLAAPQAGLAEMGRILRPGGQAVVVDFVSHNNESMRTLYGDRWLGFSSSDLDVWLNRAGFNAIACQQIPVNLGLNLLILTATREHFSV